MAAEPTVARRILEAVGAQGIERVFGLPGVHNLPFWREQGADLPEIIGVRHEQTTVYAADGLARATGGIGVALTTTGPGVANAAGAFGEAAASGSPVVLIATEIATKLARPGVVRGVLHESRDQAAIFEPLAKAVFRPRTAEDAVRDIVRAMTTAHAFPRGPVYFDVPTDVLARPAPAAPSLTIHPAGPNRDDVAKLVELLASVRHVVIWVGGGVVASGAQDEVRQLAERLGATVIPTFAGRGVLPPDHPCLVGVPPHEREVADLVADADLMLGIGSGFDGAMTRNWSMQRPPLLANINCDETEVAKNYQPDLAVLGDARLTLRAVLDALPAGQPPEPVAAGVGAAARQRLRAEAESAEPMRLLDTLSTVVDPDTVLLADMAIPGYWLAAYGTVHRTRQLQYPMGWGTLGYALPASIGPASVGRRALVVCGDGGFMFAVGELATIAQHRLPVTILVVDDGGYGMLRFDQQHVGDEIRGVELARPDFVRLAESFDIKADAVTDVGEPLAGALRAALSSREPRLVVLRASMTPPRTTSPRWPAAG
ncbi:MAG TPA: thiamine pyrophosphate-binding protein [Pseudonocardiaceae bacterium]|nr:thiamine pyrophosphate-binding protein [Pseudonocardiaceae bacterium]